MSRPAQADAQKPSSYINAVGGLAMLGSSGTGHSRPVRALALGLAGGGSSEVVIQSKTSTVMVGDDSQTDPARRQASGMPIGPRRPLPRALPTNFMPFQRHTVLCQSLTVKCVDLLSSLQTGLVLVTGVHLQRNSSTVRDLSYVCSPQPAELRDHQPSPA
ncbi:hypothetical protein NX059_005726 [Plenodomus lindquistii]|nr:hypothetical protein NX059_005726 [Plenodomus lindquistii]